MREGHYGETSSEWRSTECIKILACESCASRTRIRCPKQSKYTAWNVLVLGHGARSDGVKKKALARETSLWHRRPVIRNLAWSRLGLRIQAGRGHGEHSSPFPPTFVWRLSRPASAVSQLLNEASLPDMGTSMYDVGFAFFSRSQAILAQCECMHRVERTCDAALQASEFRTCRPFAKELTFQHWVCQEVRINQKHSSE